MKATLNLTIQHEIDKSPTIQGTIYARATLEKDGVKVEDLPIGWDDSIYIYKEVPSWMRYESKYDHLKVEESLRKFSPEELSQFQDMLRGEHSPANQDIYNAIANVYQKIESSVITIEVKS